MENFQGPRENIFGGKYLYEDFWNYNKNMKYDNGAENIRDFESRIYCIINECILKYPDKNILFIMHVSGTKMANCYFKEIPENGIISGNGLKNGEIIEYSEYLTNEEKNKKKFIARIISNKKEV